MGIRTVMIGAFALVFGISAAVGVYLLVSTVPKEISAETVMVVAANADINRGQTLAAELLTLREWPKALVPDGVITKIDDVLERTVSIPLIKGELLLERKLAVKGAGKGLAAIIPAGMRAVTIQTPNVATGVAGFILPGNKVDILLTMSNQGSADQTGGGSTITLLQNLEILAVDQQTAVPEENKVDSKELRSVTLLATPAEAARLDLGQNKGTLRLTLRNPTDVATDFVNPVTLAGLSRNPNEIAPVRNEAVAQIAVGLIPPTAVRSKKSFNPQIRTLRGTRAGMIELLVPESELTDPVDATTSPPERTSL